MLRIRIHPNLKLFIYKDPFQDLITRTKGSGSDPKQPYQKDTDPKLSLKGTVQRTRFFELTIDSGTAQGPPTPHNVFSILPLHLRIYSYSKINSP